MQTHGLFTPPTPPQSVPPSCVDQSIRWSWLVPPWTSRVRCKGIPLLVYAGARRMGNFPQAGEKPPPTAYGETQSAQEHTQP